MGHPWVSPHTTVGSCCRGDGFHAWTAGCGKGSLVFCLLLVQPLLLLHLTKSNRDPASRWRLHPGLPGSRTEKEKYLCELLVALCWGLRRWTRPQQWLPSRRTARLRIHHMVQGQALEPARTKHVGNDRARQQGYSVSPASSCPVFWGSFLQRRVTQVTGSFCASGLLRGPSPAAKPSFRSQCHAETT